MLFAILFGLSAAFIASASVFIAKRKKGPSRDRLAADGSAGFAGRGPNDPHPSSLRPAWLKGSLPLLVLVDDDSARVAEIVHVACNQWNKASGRVFFAFGGYDSNTEVFLKPSPGIVVVRFLAGLETRPHTQLLINAEGVIRASPILAPLDLPDEKTKQIVLHELGHALGLSHNSDPESVMFERAIASSVKITASDLRVLDGLYPG